MVADRRIEAARLLHENWNFYGRFLALFRCTKELLADVCNDFSPSTHRALEYNYHTRDRSPIKPALGISGNFTAKATDGYLILPT